MNKLAFIVVFILLYSIVFSQSISVVAPLPNTVRETSGLILLNGRLITHNDSGDGPILYELDTITGAVTRQTTLLNAMNRDWEDISHDGTYIYVADFGNNSGTRTDLGIYRVSIADYLTSTTGSVASDQIEFNYADQTDFTPSTFSTNFDAEGLIPFGDSLYVFTKNWGNLKTNIYPIPKTPGTYTITKIDSIDVQGLITGATYDSSNGIIMLLGYTSTPFVVELSGFTGNLFSSGQVDRLDFTQPTGYSNQTEGIIHFDQDRYYFTAEQTSGSSSGLFIWDKLLDEIEEVEATHKPVVFPNPASDMLQVECNDFIELEIYSMNGGLQLTSIQQSFDISHLETGVYFITIKTKTGSYTQKLTLVR